MMQPASDMAETLARRLWCCRAAAGCWATREDWGTRNAVETARLAIAAAIARPTDGRSLRFVHRNVSRTRKPTSAGVIGSCIVCWLLQWLDASPCHGRGAVCASTSDWRPSFRSLCGRHDHHNHRHGSPFILLPYRFPLSTAPAASTMEQRTQESWMHNHKLKATLGRAQPKSSLRL